MTVTFNTVLKKILKLFLLTFKKLLLSTVVGMFGEHTQLGVQGEEKFLPFLKDWTKTRSNYGWPKEPQKRKRAEKNMTQPMTHQSSPNVDFF